ncbi:MAG: ComEC/Rec2 family competence protein [Patescibacteria group bacterium]
MELKLRSCLFGFFLGVAVRSLVFTPWWLGLLGLFVFGCVILVIRNHPTTPTSARMLWVAMVLVGGSLGVIRCDVADLRAPKTELDQYLGRSVQFVGTVIQPPQERGQVWRTLFHPDGGRSNISVSVPLYPPVRYGDRLRISGVLVKPEAFLSDNGRMFDYPSYLALDNVYYQLKNVRSTIVGHGSGGWLKDKLFTFRELFLRRIGERFAVPESALLAGLLLGEKSSLGKPLEDAFRKAGVIHIVVLSGFNITIIGVAVMYLLSGLPRRISIVSGIVFIALFSIMTGAAATVVRSAIMAVIALLAALFYRTYDVPRALFLAAFLMVLFQPGVLIFDPSFQLSFLATAGLIYLSPMIERRLMWCHETLRTILVATLSTQLFVLPYLLYSMGDISLVSIFTNLAILPTIPFAMLSGFVATILPLGIAVIPAAIAHALLAYIFLIVRFFAELSFATVAIPYFPAWLMVGWYGITGGLLWWKYGREA